MGFGVRIGPVRVNRRGVSVGGGIGIGPFGAGYGKQVANFNGNSNGLEKFISIVLTLLFSLVIVVGFLAVKIDKYILLPIQTKLKPFFYKFRISKTRLLFLTIFGGFFGFHQYFVGRIRRAILYSITAGGFGIYVVRDIYMILSNRFLDVNDRPLLNDKFSNMVSKYWNGNILGKLQSWRKWIGILCLPGCILLIINPTQDVNRISASLCLLFNILILLNPKFYGIRSESE